MSNKKWHQKTRNGTKRAESLPPNGLPISRRERATKAAKMRTISCAKRSAAWACSASRSRRSGCQPHVPATPARYHTGITGVNRNHADRGSRPAQRAAIFNHAQHTIRLPRTCIRHNRPTYHPLHNGLGAQRAYVPRSAQRAPARPSRHNPRSRCTICRITIKKEWRSRCHGC